MTFMALMTLMTQMTLMARFNHLFLPISPLSISQCPHEGYTAQMTTGMRIFGAVLQVLSALLITWGSIAPSFAFQFRGLVSVIAPGEME